MNKSIKIVQLNMGRGAIVNDQLLDYCQNNSVDIALVQEPYTRRGIMVGLEAAPLRTQLCPGERRMNNVIHGSGIVVINPDLKVMSREDLTTENLTVMTLDIGGNKSLTLVSAYFKFRTPTIVHTTALSRILDSIEGDFIIGADVNAFSQRWFSRITDARGEAVEELIDQHRLLCHNRKSRFRTFTGARGSTNIDVTLSSPDLTNVEEWSVVTGETSSDHAIISFEIKLGNLPIGTSRPRRYADNKADWDSFTINLNSLLNENSNRLSLADIDSKAAGITMCIQLAADNSIPKRRPNKKLRPPWWTKELSDKRRALKSAYRNSTNNIGNQTLKEAYRAARNAYTAQLRRDKKSTWRHHCTKEGEYVWGNLYKWLKKGSQPAKIQSAMKKPDGSFTKSLWETASIIIDTLIPNDPNSYNEGPEPDGSYDFVPCTMEELKTALWRTSLKKAPGKDRITAGIARRAWPLISGHFLDLVNSCLHRGRFPATWKSADVTIIKKATDNDPTAIKSYRPISLLPVMAKALEKVICDRLLEETKDARSPNQHGFLKNKSTDTAIESLLNWHKTTLQKYTLAIFLDISGAFDNLDWTVLHRDLRSLGCSDSTKAITRSYLHKRTATINIGGVSKTVGLTRGCPQGSIFGPVLWNATMEKLLSTELPDYAHIQAYADDIALSIAANNRKELQQRAKEILNVILRWGNERKLTFSSAKSTAVPIKGALAPGFAVDFGNERIGSKPHAKYLGVIIDSKLSYKEHVNSLRTKSLDIFTRMRGIFGTDWGMKRENAIILYNCVLIPRVLYGVHFWHKATYSHKEKVTLDVVQRRALLGITSAYKTVSTMSLQVIAGVFPLDLEARLRTTIHESRDLPLEERDELVTRKKNELIGIWQDRWDSSPKSRWTHSLIPNIDSRLKTPLWCNHYIAQFLSGHGDFKAKLHQFSLKDSALCECGESDETPEHILFHCRIHSEPRQRLELEVLRSGNFWPCEPRILLSSRALYAALDKFAEVTLEAKRATERQAQD